MTIPSYQIHNILKDFAQQLQRRFRGEAGKGNMEAPFIPPLTRGRDRLKAVGDNLAAAILQRIADPEGAQNPGAAPRPPRPAPPEAPRPSEPAPAFEYLVMDPQGAKQSCCMTVEDAQVLVERFWVLDDTRPDLKPLPEKTDGGEV